MEHEGRFYARVTGFDLACPDCGTLHSTGIIPPGRRNFINFWWNPYISRFKCTNPNCGAVYHIGILAWKLQMGTHAARQIALDQVPLPQEAKFLRELRRHGNIGVVGKGKLNLGKERANGVELDPCTCWVSTKDCKAHYEWDEPQEK